jgi:hypothetical protein
MLAMAGSRNGKRVKGLVLVSGYYLPTWRFDVWFASVAAIPLIGDVLRFTISPISSWLGLLAVTATQRDASVADQRHHSILISVLAFLNLSGMGLCRSEYLDDYSVYQTIPISGYINGLRKLSYAAFVDEWRNIMTAYRVALMRSSPSLKTLPSLR